MANSLQHRGPDADGFYDDGYCGFGFRRLAIIDLREKANQPLCNEDQTLWLVFNGEIYNFQTLRKELEEKGHHFQTDTDGEVIVHGYEEYGEGVVKRLRGMFAFALWDRMNRKLFLARDRLGKKPLFYYYDKWKFVFASELKAILQDEEIARIINRNALWHYLSYGYVPSPASIFQDIYKLQPGHYLTCANRKISVRQYWDIGFMPEPNSEQYFIAEIRRQLEEAVKIRMVADVPLGAFLSGGIDSASVVAFMARHTEEPIKTFSIGFEESSFDETKYANMVAEQYHTDHHEFIVKANTVKILPKLIWHYDEPYADSSALPTYLLSQLTRKYVTVALNGDGGDENFAGYPRYMMESLLERWKQLPSMVRTPVASLIRAWPDNSRSALLRRAKRFLDSSSLPKEEGYIKLMQVLDHNAKLDLCKENFQAHQENSNAMLQREFKFCKDKHFLNKLLYVDIKRYLPEDLLVKMDRATMAHSLEARSPYLDHLFMEFAATIPSSFKLRGLTKKYILKKALQPYLPRAILRRQKMGFGVPLGAWLRGELQETIPQVLLSKEALQRGYFRKEKLEAMLEQHQHQRKDFSAELWNLFCLELWHRQYVDQQKINII